MAARRLFIPIIVSIVIIASFGFIINSRSGEDEETQTSSINYEIVSSTPLENDQSAALIVEDDTRKLVVVDEQGNIVTSLSNEDEYVVIFRLSPNRDMIVFTVLSDQEDENTGIELQGIYTINADGSDRKDLLDNVAQQIYVSISPDNETVAYTTPTEVGIIDIETSEVTILHEYPPISIQDSDAFLLGEPFWDQTGNFINVLVYGESYYADGTVATLQINAETGEITEVPE
jgi:hypothetical protein